MLLSLCIENFAIVSHLELDFQAGMTAFTGETGAGKSIMIDALILALGGRGDVSAIRPGSSQCNITATFGIGENSLAANWLAAHDLSIETEEIILRRVIHSEGRSKSYINGQPFPLNKVKELSDFLVNIHGQHQYQTLLEHHTHRQQLDLYADHSALLDEIASLYKQCTKIKQDLQNLEKQSSLGERVELLTYQLEELSKLNPVEGEVTELHQEHQLLHHAVDYLKTAQQIVQLLNGDEHFNVCSTLHQTIQLIGQLPEHKTLMNVQELLNNALIQCEEAGTELESFAEQIQLDPERLNEVEARLSHLHQIARKYQVDVKGLCLHKTTIENELKQLGNAEEEKKKLTFAYQELCAQYEQKAAQLRESRMQQAQKLGQDITNIIQKLGMPKGYITIEFSPLEKMTIHGLDRVEYKVCTNPGMAPDSLTKVASGGELSRISLAIYMLTAEKGSTPTLLFDEVDVGIGGATAALVGELLRSLGERLQIFCVTHQPQVASYAHHHFRVEKNTQAEQTFSNIIILNKEQKVQEIARMLGGLTITEQTLSHAQEMLEAAEI